VLGAEPARYHGRLARDVLAGGNMAAWRSTLLDLDGFDPRLGAGTPWPSAEDNDLGLRLLESGHTIAYVPAALVRHRAWRAGASYPGVRWRYGRGKGGFYAKHARLDGAYGLRRASSDVGRRLVRGVVSIRRPRYAAGELMYAAGVIVGMVGWAVRRPKA
jgi:GT2 family glycosyltransferase